MIHIVVKLWQYDNPIVIWLNYQVHHKTNCVLSINKIKNQLRLDLPIKLVYSLNNPIQCFVLHYISKCPFS